MTPLVSDAAHNLQKLLASHKVGDAIPGQHDLARILGVSRPTVRGLLQRYLDQGAVTSRRGDATYLMQPVSKPTAVASGGTTIGLVVPKIEIPWVARIVRELEKVEKTLDVNLVLKSTGDQREQEIALLSQLWRTGIRKIIVFPSWGNVHNPEYQRMINAMRSSESAIVSIDNPIHNFDIPCVSTDHVQTGYLLTNHLIERGHRQILMVGGFEAEGFSFRERLHGYWNALRDAGIPNQEHLIIDTSECPLEAGDAAYQQVSSYLSRRGMDFSAVIGVHDDYAWGAAKALIEYGKKIPSDVSIVGVDDNRKEVMGVPLTTMAHPSEKIARLAMRLVSQRGNDTIEVGHRSLFSPILVERGSVARAQQALS